MRAESRCNTNAELEAAIWEQGGSVELSPRQLGALVEFAKVTNTMILAVSKANLRATMAKLAETSEAAWLPEGKTP